MSRIVAPAALVVLVSAGCGSAARPQNVAAHGVPPTLAQGWERQASAIAAASAAGNDCRAQALAVSLRSQVIDQEHKVPLRLRSPLVTGLDSLVERTTCTQTVTVETTPGPPRPQQPEPPKKPKPPAKPHGHDHGHHR